MLRELIGHTMRGLTIGADFAAMTRSDCFPATVLQPRLRPGGLRNASSTNTQPALYPNTRKYRDAGVKPAVGRSGSATVQMRALLGVSGTTDVEVTTGSFDEQMPHLL